MATATATPAVIPDGWEPARRGKIKPINPPAPLVRVHWSRPKTWILQVVNAIQTLLLVVLAAFCGMLVGAALYYILFQTNADMTAWWHHVVPSDYWRHLIRNGGEGFFGGFFGMFVGWNHYKKRKATPGAFERFLADKLGLAIVGDPDPLSGWQLTKGIVLVPFFAIPGGLVGIGLVALFHYRVVSAKQLTDMVGFSLPSNASIVGAAVAFFLTGLPVKIVGLGAAHFFGRRVMRGAFDDLQLWCAEFVYSLSRYSFSKSHWVVRVLTPPAFQARYNHEARNGQDKPSIWMQIVLWILGIVTFGLVVFGGYVIFWVARH